MQSSATETTQLYSCYEPLGEATQLYRYDETSTLIDARVNQNYRLSLLSRMLIQTVLDYSRSLTKGGLFPAHIFYITPH